MSRTYRTTAADKTIERLTSQGWEYVHTAEYSPYHYAGTTSAMQTRKGYEYIRVHHGRTVNHHSRGRIITNQITTVMRRKAP